MDQECKYLIPTPMESSLFLLLQTLPGIGMNKLLTVNASKSGLGDTSPSNLKLFWWQERLFNPTLKVHFKFRNITSRTSCGQKYSAKSSRCLMALQVCHKVLIFQGIQHWSCRWLCFNGLNVSAGEHLHSSGINGMFPIQWGCKLWSLSALAGAEVRVVQSEVPTAVRWDEGITHSNTGCNQAAVKTKVFQIQWAL